MGTSYGVNMIVPAGGRPLAGLLGHPSLWCFRFLFIRFSTSQLMVESTADEWETGFMMELPEDDAAME
jgi:hypothetical protein